MRRRESIERWTSTYFRKMTFLKNIVFFWVGFQGEKPGIFYSGGYQVPNFSGTGTLLAGFTGMGDFLTEKSEFMLERQWKKFPATSSVDLYPSNKHTGIPFWNGKILRIKNNPWLLWNLSAKLKKYVCLELFVSMDAPGCINTGICSRCLEKEKYSPKWWFCHSDLPW